jgi:glutathione S-transferase
MKLYYNPLSTYSQKAMIAFNEKGIDYAGQVVNLTSPEGRAAYEQVYPLGRVPFLQASDDHHVPESTSIIEYLEDKFPDSAHLIPKGGGDAARQVRFMDRMADLYFNDPITELLFQQLGFRTRDEAKAARAHKFVAVTYAQWDKRLASQKWMCGEDFSMADCASIPALFYAQSAAPFASHPHIVAYWQRALQRPSYVKVKAEFEPIWNAMLAQHRVP